MENIDTIKIKIDSLTSKANPNFDELTDEERVDKVIVFQELVKREGLNLANSLIQECEPLIIKLKQELGENSVTYKEYSNKFVDAAITYILIQVNGNIFLSMLSDLNQLQKNTFKNQNAFTISLLNKLEKYYRTPETQGWVNKIKNKIAGSEQRVNPSSSCYIATIIYEDYNSKEVCVLREYRDCILDNNKFGRFIINIYYKSSPVVKPIVSKSQIIQKILKYYLDSLVRKFTKANNKNSLFKKY